MKYLHTMVRVADLEKSLAFYCGALGLTEVRRTEHTQGGLVMVVGEPGIGKTRTTEQFAAQARVYTFTNIVDSTQQLITTGAQCLAPAINNSGELAFVAGAGSFVDDMLRTLRVENLAAAQPGPWPRLAREWLLANHAFHDVIYAAANVPLIERMAKAARRTFLVTPVWAMGADLDELYLKNDRQHRAIREAIAARSPDGARVLAREHVLSSGRLLEAILEQVASQSRSDAPAGARGG